MTVVALVIAPSIALDSMPEDADTGANHSEVIMAPVDEGYEALSQGRIFQEQQNELNSRR